MVTESIPGPWETVTGLPDDIDAYITNPRFGSKDEYTAVVEGGVAPMFLIDLVNEEGELVATPGYSCGAGWVIQANGVEITHPLRSNIVNSSIYGQLITRVTRDLAVDMSKYGDSALVAKSWDGLGFHWKQEEHATLGQKKGLALMPVDFLGEREAVKAAPGKAVKKAAVAAPAADAALEKQLAVLAAGMTVDAFQKAAIKLPGVADDDALIASVLDESPAGYWATHQE